MKFSDVGNFNMTTPQNTCMLTWPDNVHGPDELANFSTWDDDMAEYSTWKWTISLNGQAVIWNISLVSRISPVHLC